MQSCSSTLSKLSSQIKQWGLELGFADIGITHTDLSAYEAAHFNWIGENFHGEMDYMQRHGTKRTRPTELEPGTASIISVRLNYLDLAAYSPFETLHNSEQAYISRYALGKDYHKLMRKRLQQLATKIAEQVPEFSYRAFCDSAPVLERPIAEQAGLGFIGKNSLIIHPRAGSWFFLGELYTNLPLPADAPFEKQGCGPCTACIDECPTQAIVGNAVVDARRCISYLTIEYSGSIPEEFRAKMGNRIYGCDDCQLVCPWNKFTEQTQEAAFSPNQSLDNVSLLELWTWQESDFLKRFEGSPIRRIGYLQWKRNLAIAIGNIDSDVDTIEKSMAALQQQKATLDLLVNEHIDWAIKQLNDKLAHLLAIKNTKTSRPANFEPLDLTNQKSTQTIKPFVARKYYLPKPTNN
ncbi:MAG: tRNA epoxyqueuosine(34) reductase QueG [Thiotrichales bacterium]|nr:tRNA epoxyqueuosine(34) reductase QueG [Thiotrichales bacterium]